MKIPYRADIDGLRAFSVLPVLFFHMNDGLLPGGYVGVDVFFVISGYLIIGQILQELEMETFSLLRFWEQRILRIYPALIVMVTLTSLIASIIFLPENFKSAGRMVAAACLGFSNIILWREAGYFDSSSDEKPLLHTWSLGIEDQFYLVAPLVLLSISTMAKKNYKIFKIALLLLFFCSFLISIFCLQKYRTATFFLLPTRAWEILAGGLCFLIGKSTTKFLGFFDKLISFLGLLMISGCYFFYSNKTSFPGASALPPVIGASLLIFSGRSYSKQPFANKLLTLKPLPFIGKISYSFYLYHWPILSYLSYAGIKIKGLLPSLIIITTILLIAFTSYHLIEKPFRKLKGNKRIAASLLAVSISIFYAFTGYFIWHSNGFPNRFNLETQKFFTNNNQIIDMGLLDNRETFTQDIPNNIQKLGSPKPDPDFILWGDSHAGHLVPMLKQICDNRKLNCSAIYQGGAPPILDFVYTINHIPSYDKSKFVKKSYEYIKDSNTKLILIAGNWEAWQNHDEELGTKFIATCQKLKNNGKNLAFLRDVPSFPAPILRSMALRSIFGLSQDTLKIEINSFLKQRTFENLVVPKLEEMGITIIDPIPFFTISNQYQEVLITPFGDEGPFYRDTNHLTFLGAMKLRACFEPFFDKYFGKN